MTTALPRDPGEPPEFGVPSPELTARAESGFEKFLARGEGRLPVRRGDHAMSSAGSFFHGDGHPWLHKTVRDIASRGEGELTAIVHEKTGSRTVRVAHIRPASGIEWTTSADNIQLVP
ncbi:hypothetical protein ACFV9D_05635 [Streptomyces sp. NPDC059875]|uniref:hypothetical protein n=1 Tax=unclassified Streptomyces TaxID=2593676 RepID=UPI00365EB8BD